MQATDGTTTGFAMRAEFVYESVVPRRGLNLSAAVVESGRLPKAER
jgi:hypothetical protein